MDRNDVAEANAAMDERGVGHAIFHDGDYYGRNVNLASRLAGLAEPGQTLVDAVWCDSWGSGRTSIPAVSATSR